MTLLTAIMTAKEFVRPIPGFPIHYLNEEGKIMCEGELAKLNEFDVLATDWDVIVTKENK